MLDAFDTPLDQKVVDQHCLPVLCGLGIKAGNQYLTLLTHDISKAAVRLFHVSPAIRDLLQQLVKAATISLR